MKNSPIPIYVINLEERNDRKKDVLEEMQRIFQESIKDLNFIRAIPTPRNGAIGCSISHGYALSKYLYETNAPACMIIEDDFSCGNIEYFLDIFKNLLKEINLWDVALLANNQAYKVRQLIHENIYEVHNSQTASAYLVKREYAPELIKLYFNSAQKLSDSIGCINNEEARFFYALDMLWKNEQLNNKYVASFPPCAVQRKSFSNIENKTVNYGV